MFFYYFSFLLDTLSLVEVKHELSKIDIGVNKLNYFISPFTDDPVGNVSGKTLLLLFV